MMTKRVVFIVLLLSLLIAGGALAQEATEASDGWQQIPLEGAVCARGTPYSFFFHPGSPEKLVVYFQGGGACWSAGTCAPGGTFDDSVESDELERYGGIFDFDDPQNPVADYTFVVVPYCTGDVHTGAAAREYQVGESRFTIQFNGFANAQAILDWTYANVESPSELIVTGSSAGAYGAIYNAPYVLTHYSDARAVIFGDAGMGIVPDDWDGFATWNLADTVFTGDGYADVSPGANLITTLYTAASRAFPDARIAEYTAVSDQIQTGFYMLQGGIMEDWSVRIEANVAELDTLANFRSYLGWGGTHTILASRLFYQMQVNGVAFRDWFADLIGGAEVASVHCEDCDTAELTTGQ